MDRAKFWRVRNLKFNPHSVQARLPEAYKKYADALKQPQAPVHYIPEPMNYAMDPISKEKIRVETREIPLKFPKEADEGIWGGEGVIQGFIKEKKFRRRFPNYWIPKLRPTIVYSEILNEYMNVTVTERTLRLIDENCGFDHYILKTPVQDLKSQLALSLRRKMLLALVNKEKYHEDEEKNKEIFAKYEKYIIPLGMQPIFNNESLKEKENMFVYELQKEEVEWFGLTQREAVQKQRILESEQKPPVPLKHELRLKLIEQLKNKDNEESEESGSYMSWLKRLNPFSN